MSQTKVSRCVLHFVPCSVLCLALLLGGFLLLGVPGATAQEETGEAKETVVSPRILVGPDLLASRDGEIPHIEPTIAAHPLDPDNLVAAAMVFPHRGQACRLYTSLDGGATWKTIELQDQAENGLGDPQVVFTPRGTALFGCLTKTPAPDTGRTRAAFHLYRSEDGGLTWSAPTSIRDQSYDHPVMTVDGGVGPYAGRVYVGALYGWEPTLGVLRSEDDGRSFIGPVEFAHSTENGLNVTGLVVLSDGTLAVSYVETPGGARSLTEPYEATLWLVTSEDGGVTFSEPKKVATRIVLPHGEEEIHRLGTIPMLAVDASPGATRDHLHQVWNDGRTGVWRVLVATSVDRGGTWSEPVSVDPADPEMHQFLPAPAVNKEGSLGVTYFETRGIADTEGYRPRFSASIDGGVSFLPSRSLSAEPLKPDATGANHRTVRVTIESGTDQRFLSFVSVLGRWLLGGDYIGLVADASGDFHPLWPDARDRAFQLWTSRVRVEKPKTGDEPPGPPSLGGEVAEGPLELRRVNAQIEVVSDPLDWNPETRELTVPIRLRNISDRPIHPPLEVEVTSVGFGGSLEDLPPEHQAFWRDRIPRILNADNGEEGPGALFAYTETLGDFETLEPGAVTAARTWRIHGRSDAMPPIQLEIRGRVPGPKRSQAARQAAHRSAHRMAVTFDDLPLGYAADQSFERQSTVTRKLLAALAEREVPAVGFVNESKLYSEEGIEEGGTPDPRRVALLRQWLDDGHELGNHTYSHPDLHRISLEDFQRDVLQGERVLRELIPAQNGEEGEPATLFFRHPFLHTGRSAEIRRGLESFLEQHHYRVAPVTVDNSEWIFALAYDRALTAGDEELARRVAAEYVPYMEDKVAFFERNSRDLFDREIPQVLLVHANRLNADHFGALARRLAARGYTFVPLTEALEDPAYDSADTYTGAGGLTWLHRWALTREMPEDFYRGEPRTPAFVLEAAGVESE